MRLNSLKAIVKAVVGAAVLLFAGVAYAQLRL